MKKKLLSFLMLLVAGVILVVPVWGQGSRVNFSRNSVHRVGLKQRWSIQLASRRGSLRELTHYVSSQTRILLHEIVSGNRRLLISEHDVDRFGTPLGREGSERLAQRKLIQAQEAGWESKITSDLVPEFMLYAVTHDAAVHAIDAQTGRVRWTTVVGNSNFPSFRPGVNEKYVAVINGSTLYLLRRKTGEVFWSQMMTGVPAFGPVMAGSSIYTLSFNGLVESLNLEKIANDSWSYLSAGNATSPFVVSTSTICWMTDKGYLYVRDVMEGGLRYRFEANDTFPSSPTYQYPDRLYAAAADGFVYCLDEKTGKIRWRVSTGKTIEHRTVAIADALYVLVDDGGMLQLDATSGEQKWWVPRIRSFLAASDEQVYCVDEEQRMVVLNVRSGAVLRTVSMREMDFHLTNFQTDRIFLGNRYGSLQCLHESQTDTPIVHIHLRTLDVKGKPVPDMPKSSRVVEQEEAEPGRNDPIGGEEDAEDPFGGGDDEDPFGGGDDEDPFGGGDDDEDPFGGDDDEDPFGGDDDEDPFGG